MTAPIDSPNPIFYLHLPVVQYLRVLVPFTLFKAHVLAIANVPPSHISPND